MIIDALTNPPVPEWNELSNQERDELGKAWEMYSCPHSCGGKAFYFYDELRTILKERERRYFRATMEG